LDRNRPEPFFSYSKTMFLVLDQVYY
jgi:hypothetical protein